MTTKRRNATATVILVPAAVCLWLIYNSCVYAGEIEAAWTPRSSTHPDAEPWQQATDEDWLDDRFNQMDKGPFLGLSMSASHPFPERKGAYAAKGLAIRVGDEGEAAVLFDRGLLQMSAAWSGSYLQIPDSRFGLIQHPQPAGQALFATPAQPGWKRPSGLTQTAKADDPPTVHESRWAPLPQQWGHYLGLYRHGQRTILHYTVGGSRILEMPWAERRGDLLAVTRTIEAAAAEVPLSMQLLEDSEVGLSAIDGMDLLIVPDGDEVLALGLAGDKRHARLGLQEQTARLTIDARPETVRLKLFYWRGKASDLARFAALVQETSEPSDLDSLTRGGPPLWTETPTTRGKLGQACEAKPFAVDTLTLPYDNPYQALFYVTAVGFLPDGRIAIATIYGDVWTVAVSDDQLSTLTWKRMASGMYQPLGLAVREGKIYILERGQLTRLHDLNGNGEADYYENVYNGWQSTGAGHAYDTALQLAPDGSFYFFKGQVSGNESVPESGCLLRILPDASGHEIFATGFRHPIGLGMGPDGTLTGADQEGNWIPATRIDRYRRGGFYGDMRTHHRQTPPETYDQPICWLPHAVDNSAGGQIWIPEGSWGPLGGEILHLSWGRCRLFVLLREQIEDQWQGGVVRLPCDKLLSGPITGAFHPGDGHLYVVGLYGWQTAAQKDGCLQRIRYTGHKMYLPIELNSYPDGISLRFTQPLDPESARDRGRYQVEQWNYRYSGDYGSDHWSVREPDRQGHDRLRIDEVLLSEDGRRVFLKIPDLRPAMQTEIRYDLRADDGTRVTDAIYHTIHRFQQREGP